MEKLLRAEIRDKIKTIVEQKRHRRFVPGKDKIHYSGSVYDEKEIIGAVDTLLDEWLVLGNRGRKFETMLSGLVGTKDAVLANSGSSANLLAFAALKSNQLGERKVHSRDEVITSALSFPTSFNVIFQNNLIPVLLDCDLATCNIRAEDLEKALSHKTTAIMLTHMLGNPNEMDVVMDFAEDHNLYVIEDACDALGAKYDGKMVGSIGTFGTFSFYPAHQITMGEGGAIVGNDMELITIVRSIRDWGHACACPTCGISSDPNFLCHLRFQAEIENMPEDYDKRYIYTEIGYNLKPIEVQAAMGIEQLKKLPEFIRRRKKNFERLYTELKNYEDYFILPESLPKAEPCWFAFPLTIRKDAPFERKDITEWFNKRNIEIKPLFAGNIIRHPAYKDMDYRRATPLNNSDFVVHNSFFMGVYPGITAEMMDFMAESIKGFMDSVTK